MVSVVLLRFPRVIACGSANVLMHANVFRLNIWINPLSPSPTAPLVAIPRIEAIGAIGRILDRHGRILPVRAFNGIDSNAGFSQGCLRSTRVYSVNAEMTSNPSLALFLKTALLLVLGLSFFGFNTRREGDKTLQKRWQRTLQSRLSWIRQGISYQRGKVCLHGLLV